MKIERILSFHSKRIQDLSKYQSINSYITIGEDGTVRMWDFIKDKQFYSKASVGVGSCVDVMPYADANQGRILAAGLGNNTVIVLLIGSHDFMDLKVFKAQDSKIIKVRYSTVIYFSDL
jgi:WD40 repeat protein